MYEFTERTAKKGYSAYYICELMNQEYGWRVHINTFRKAVQNQSSDYQKNIYETACKILDGLPVRECERSDLAGRARRAQISLKDVWRYRNATKGENRSYAAFSQAIRRRMTPMESALFAEVERIIENEADKVREFKDSNHER